MTVALPSPAPVSTLHPTPRRLRLAPEKERFRPSGDGASSFAAYVVLLPQDIDPVALFARTGLRPHIRSVDLDDIPNPSRDATSPSSVPGNSPVRGGSYLVDDPVRIDAGRHVAELDGVELDLTHMEFALLARLVECPGQVHSREQLVRHVWQHEHIGDGRTVDVHIARLRRKLGPAHRDRIVTVRRVGYKYVRSA